MIEVTLPAPPEGAIGWDIYRQEGGVSFFDVWVPPTTEPELVAQVDLNGDPRNVE